MVESTLSPIRPPRLPPAFDTIVSPSAPAYAVRSMFYWPMPEETGLRLNIVDLLMVLMIIARNQNQQQQQLMIFFNLSLRHSC
ncbi:hypothetical protein BVRB_8g189250 [Beta vulgaris subsp. vulgaris]|nr:hypothetical protein BVRB_8g189250 [Beta vulgaris subsp. vulgaris]